MKNFVPALFLTLALLTVVPVQGALGPLRIAVSGSVVTQELISPSEGRIRTSKIDNARIFAEFGVSPDDYALTVNAGFSEMNLEPKSASSGLPSIRVIDFSGFVQAIDTQRNRARVFIDAASPATSNLFEGLHGTATGLAKFQGPFSAITAIEHHFTLNAAGKDVSGSAGARAIIKMKIVSGRPFEQTP